MGTPKRKDPDRARTPAAKEELRARILQAAIVLFVDEGYHGFTMRKLAARIGYTPTTIYSYFENKDELLLEVIGNGWDTFRGYMDVAPGDPVAALVRLGERYLDFAFQNPELYKLMFITRPHFLFDLRAEKVSTRWGILNTVADVAGGAFDAAGDREAREHLAGLFWAVVHGLASLALTVPLVDEKWARGNLRFLLGKLGWQEAAA